MHTNVHLEQFFLGVSVYSCASLQKTGAKEESSKKQNTHNFEPEENQDMNQMAGQAAVQCLKLQNTVRERTALEML